MKTEKKQGVIVDRDGEAIVTITTDLKSGDLVNYAYEKTHDNILVNKRLGKISFDKKKIYKCERECFDYARDLQSEGYPDFYIEVYSECDCRDVYCDCRE